MKKAPAWPAETVAAVITAYQKAGNPSDSASLEKIGEPFGKNAAMVRQKLTVAGVYKKAERKTGSSAGATRTTKIQCVTALESLLGFSTDELVSLEKGNKDALEKVVTNVKAMRSELETLRGKLKA